MWILLGPFSLPFLHRPTGGHGGGPAPSPPRGFHPLSFLPGHILKSAVAGAVSVSKGMGDLCPFIQQAALYRTDATC